ncbi:MAG TPA: hypothetical protein VGR28_15450 [Candidatus Thermoplasmatota archaeon]|nr:hypothetical protein [Candidatus Thermoplasmatota archaeon]
MRTLILSLAAVAMLLLPTASASLTFNENITASTVVVAATVPYSTPLFQSSVQYRFNLAPGDSLDATLTWSDTAVGTPVGNDLDITVFLPSVGPVPIDLSTPDAIVATVQGSVAVRVARQTCTDAIAESNNHALLGDPQGSEAVSFAVPAGGETGTYVVLVRGFVVTTDQPYTLSVTVTSGGADVTAARVVPFPGLPGGQPTTFITTNPYCQLI